MSLHSTFGHKFSASRIAETAWENQCSNLLHLETDSCLILLLLICVFLALLMMHCNKSSLKPALWPRIARPMCDGRPFASSPFRRLAGRGPSFLGCPFWWAMQFALSLARCLTSQDSAPRYWEDSLYECGRPHDTLSCLFSTSLWLGQGQSILTQSQQTNDIDMTCYKTLPTKSLTCLQVGPMSLEWPVAPPGGFDQSSLSPSQEDPNDGHLEDTLLAPPHLRWRRDALQPPELHRGCLDRNTGVHIPEGGHTRGLNGSSFSSQTSRKENITTSVDLPEATTSSAHKKFMGKTSFFHALQIPALRFPLFGTFIPINANAGGSAICIHKDLLPDGAVVTHVVTCQGRDHVVNMGSGCRSLVVVNVHFEPEVTLRSLRGRLRLTTPHTTLTPLV